MEGYSDPGKSYMYRDQSGNRDGLYELTDSGPSDPTCTTPYPAVHPTHQQGGASGYVPGNGNTAADSPSGGESDTAAEESDDEKAYVLLVMSDGFDTPDVTVTHSGTPESVDTDTEKVYAGDTERDHQTRNLSALPHACLAPGATSVISLDSSDSEIDQCDNTEPPWIAVSKEDIPDNIDTSVIVDLQESSSKKENSCTASSVSVSTSRDQHPVAMVDRRSTLCNNAEPPMISVQGEDQKISDKDKVDTSAVGESPENSFKTENSCVSESLITSSDQRSVPPVDGETAPSRVSEDSDSQDMVVPTRRKRVNQLELLESDSDQNRSDFSEEEVSFKVTKKARKIASDSEEDSGHAEQFETGEESSSSPAKGVLLKKSREASQMDSSESEGDRSGDSRADATSGSSEEDCIEADEVDTSAILSDDEKQGRRKLKRKFLLERSRKLKEVKKNWKKRRSVETDNKSFVRIRRHAGSGSDSSDEDDPRLDMGSPHQSLSSSGGESLDGFIEADQTAEPSLATYLPKIRGRTLSLRDAFTHFLSVLVNGAIDADLLRPESLRLSDDYESLQKPSLRKIGDVIDNAIKVVTSTAWKITFRTELESRPCMSFMPYHESYGNCKACALPDRIASEKVAFSGPLYDRETLLVSSQGDSSGEDSSSAQSPTQEEMLTDRSFSVGRFCSHRSRVFHKLYHFRFNLLESCRRKVKNIQTFRLYKSEEDIFDQCMQDTKWIDSQFDRLNQCVDAAERYTSKESM